MGVCQKRPPANSQMPPETAFRREVFSEAVQPKEIDPGGGAAAWRCWSAYGRDRSSALDPGGPRGSELNRRMPRLRAYEVCTAFGGRPPSRGHGVAGGFTHGTWRLQAEGGTYAVKLLNQHWREPERRRAYEGTFELERQAVAPACPPQSRSSRPMATGSWT
jgi:hypothetical protein